MTYLDDPRHSFGPAFTVASTGASQELSCFREHRAMASAPVLPKRERRSCGGAKVGGWEVPRLGVGRCQGWGLSKSQA